MYLDLLKVFLLTWLLVTIISWTATGSFFFFDPQATLVALVTDRDVRTILNYKLKKISYQVAFTALRTRNPDLAVWEIEILLLDKGVEND